MPAGESRSRARSASCARRPGSRPPRRGVSSSGSTCRTRSPTSAPSVPGDRPDPRRGDARADGGARGPLGAVRRGAGDDPRRPDHRRDERRRASSGVALERCRAPAMTELHVLRVFIGPDGRGGNPLGVFLDGAAIAPGPAPGRGRRARLQRDRLRRRHRRRRPRSRHRPHLHARPPSCRSPATRPSGRPGCSPSAARRSTSCAARPATSRPGPTTTAGAGSGRGRSGSTTSTIDQLAGRRRGRRAVGPADGRRRAATSGPGRTNRPGRLRSRYFADRLGILEDEATGAAAVVMGASARARRWSSARVSARSCVVRPGPADGHGRRRRPRRARRGPPVRRPRLIGGHDRGSPRLGRHRRRPRRARLAAAYWARPGPATASWASSGSSSAMPTAPRPTTAGSSGCPTTGPTTSAWRSAPTRPGPRSRPRPAASRSSRSPAASTCGPADPAIPQVDYTDSLAAEGVPFELLDAAEVHAPLAAVAARRRRHARCARPQGGLADPFRGNAAHRRLATGRGATCATARRSRAIRRGRRRRTRSTTGDGTHATARVVLDRRRLDQRAARARSTGGCR